MTELENFSSQRELKKENNMLQINVLLPILSETTELEITSKNYKTNRKKIQDSLVTLKRKQKELEDTIIQIDKIFASENRYPVIPNETVKEIQQLIDSMVDFKDADSVVKTLLTESYKIIGYEIPKGNEKYKTHVLYKLCLTTSLSLQMGDVLEKMFIINNMEVD